MAFKTVDGCILRLAICRGFSLDPPSFYVTPGNDSRPVKKLDICQTYLRFFWDGLTSFPV